MKTSEIIHQYIIELPSLKKVAYSAEIVEDRCLVLTKFNLIVISRDGGGVCSAGLEPTEIEIE